MSDGLQSNASVPAAPERREHGGLWHWLFGTDIPEQDRAWYETTLREGRTALSVLLDNEAECDHVIQMLEEFRPIDIDDTGTVASSRPEMIDADLGTRAATQRADVKGQEEHIPVVKEELDVGKRTTERRYRIRTYVVERPIEQALNLRDERVVIEHRPVSGGQAAGSAEMPTEREYEVVERHEEPVIGKRARTEEEVVVRREVNDRTETVRDTVRETKVDVDVDKEKADQASTVTPRR